MYDYDNSTEKDLALESYGAKNSESIDFQNPISRSINSPIYRREHVFGTNNQALRDFYLKLSFIFSGIITAIYFFITGSFSIMLFLMAPPFIYLVLLIVNGKSANDSNTTIEAPTPSTPYLTSSPDEAEEQKNIKICEQIAYNYHSTHLYTLDDMYVCGNMAQDVWDLLKARGINAKIVIGNNQKDLFTNGSIESAINDCNHAWVLAEVIHNTWLAIECTSGYVVYKSDNCLYYRGFEFSNPKNYQKYLDLSRDYYNQYEDYAKYLSYYNKLVEQYNNANYDEQTALLSGVRIAKESLNEKENAIQKTIAGLNTIMNVVKLA